MALNKGLSFIPTTYCGLPQVLLDLKTEKKHIKNLFNSTVAASPRSRRFLLVLILLTTHQLWQDRGMESAPKFVLNPEHLLRGKSTCISPQKCIHWHLMLINGEECRPPTEQKENIKWQIIYLKDQRRKLNIFKNDKSVVIQKADKGGLTVIMHRAAHDKESQRQLHNTSFYRKLNKNQTAYE